MDARLMLEAAERAFPIAEMGDKFKGAHSLVLHNGAVCLTVWTKNRCWSFSLGAEEEARATTPEGCDACVAEMRGCIPQPT